MNENVNLDANFRNSFRQSGNLMLPHFDMYYENYTPIPPCSMLIKVLSLSDPSEYTTLIHGGWGRYGGIGGLFFQSMKYCANRV